MRSWRSGAKVEKKLLSQWFVKTTVFAKEMAEGLLSEDLKLGWRDIIKLQKHWIGSIFGYFYDFKVKIKTKTKNSEEMEMTENLRVWLSKPSELENAKYIIIRSDHYLVNFENSENCVLNTFDGGIKQINFFIQNPITNIKMPVFTVCNDSIPLIPASSDCRVNETLSEEEYPKLFRNDHFLSEIDKIYQNLQIENLENEANKSNKKSVKVSPGFPVFPASLKLRDWLVSRQRKWGTPIPAIFCRNCQQDFVIHPEEFSAKEKGNKCPKCKTENIQIESDTLDTFFDSSWYYLRYLDYKNKENIFDPEKVNSFLPVDIYIGGKEHATLHLFYARFMSYFLNSIGMINCKETFTRLIPVGVVQGETLVAKNSGKYLSYGQVTVDGEIIKESSTGEIVEKKWEKMSKSKNNGLEPDIEIEKYGLDTMRFLCVSEVAPTTYRKWPSTQFPSFLKFQPKLWELMNNFVAAKEDAKIHLLDEEEWKKTEESIFETKNYYLKLITHNFNTTYQISVAISKLQALVAFLKKTPKVNIKDSFEFERALGSTLICLYPIMPAFIAELWQRFREVANLTETDSLFDLDKEIWMQKWPEVDDNFNLELNILVNGNEEGISKIPRNILDNLDLNTALEFAYETEGIENKVPRENCKVVSFIVEPGFRSVLNISDKIKEEERKRIKSEKLKAQNTN